MGYGVWFSRRHNSIWRYVMPKCPHDDRIECDLKYRQDELYRQMMQEFERTGKKPELRRYEQCAVRVHECGRFNEMHQHQR